MVKALQGLPGGRYLVQDVGGWERLQADPRSPLFHIENVQGYNPVQLRRYWVFVRKLSNAPLPYNLSLFHDPPEIASNLLDIKYIVSGDRWLSMPSHLVTRAGRLSLFEVLRPHGQASLLPNWRVVHSSEEALRVVTDPSFDPSEAVILEDDPDLSPVVDPNETRHAIGQSTLNHVRDGPQDATIKVTVAEPSVLLVRTPYDRNWNATIDGRGAPLIPADYLVQAIPVPSGSHTVHLAYRDRSVGAGLLGSLASLIALGAVALVMRFRTNRS